MSASVAAAASRPSPAQPKSRPRPPLLPDGSDERILIRLSPTARLRTAKRRRKRSLLSLSRKDSVAILTERWDEWAPVTLPVGRLVPAAAYNYLQVDGVPSLSVRSLEVLARDFGEHNPELGRVATTRNGTNLPTRLGQRPWSSPGTHWVDCFSLEMRRVR
ncbi:hypothetical protein B0H12DRAFT_1238034 [Mycena haematopus]|nr:hypothetical protein B0H12DRAFT_1238034 [Mycena haematopus]